MEIMTQDVDEREVNDCPPPEELAEFWEWAHREEMLAYEAHLTMAESYLSDEGGPE